MNQPIKLWPSWIFTGNDVYLHTKTHFTYFIINMYIRRLCSAFCQLIYRIFEAMLQNMHFLEK